MSFIEKINKYYIPYPQNRPLAFQANAEAVEALIGIQGEMGEVADILKKHWMYEKPLDRTKLLEEFGDTFHYFSRLVDQCGFTLEEVEAANVAKLAKRFPDGYTHEAAIAQRERV